MLVTGGHDPVDSRNVRDLDLEHTRHSDNTREANIRHGGFIAMTERARFRRARQTFFDCGETRAEPADLPCAPRCIVESTRCLKILFHTRHD
jgi:hypothetical protein